MRKPEESRACKQKRHPDRSEANWSQDPAASTRSFVRCKQNCHPDRSEAQWRDLLFIIHNIEFEWKRCPPLCHPDRSEAEWRDLQFNGPLVEMFSDRTVSPI